MEVERGETTNQGRELKTNKTKQTNGREMRLEGRDYSEEMVHLTSICMYVCMCALALYMGGEEGRDGREVREKGKLGREGRNGVDNIRKG